MRVLERGVIPAERVHIARCDVCNTKVEFQRKEGTITGDGDQKRVEVECPVCKATIKDRIKGTEA